MVRSKISPSVRETTCLHNDFDQLLHAPGAVLSVESCCREFTVLNLVIVGVGKRAFAVTTWSAPIELKAWPA